MLHKPVLGWQACWDLESETQSHGQSLTTVCFYIKHSLKSIRYSLFFYTVILKKPFVLAGCFTYRPTEYVQETTPNKLRRFLSWKPKIRCSCTEAATLKDFLSPSLIRTFVQFESYLFPANIKQRISKILKKKKTAF